MPELARLTSPQGREALERAALAIVAIGSCEQHGPHLALIRLAARSARRDHGALVAGIMWAQLAAGAIAERAVSERYGHACEIETSVAIVLAPDSVYADRISPPRLVPSSEPLAEPPSPRVDRPVWFEEWTEDGALGDPRQASPAPGEEVVEIAHRRALEFARRFSSSTLPGSEP